MIKYLNGAESDDSAPFVIFWEINDYGMSNRVCRLLYCAINLFTNSRHDCRETGRSTLPSINGRQPLQALWPCRTTKGLPESACKRGDVRRQ